jgi:2-polyprenyl-3-methyl-5-hydroxy-6-metoxy-1,4-benzoquinol methylase
MAEHRGIRSCVNCGADDAEIMHTFTKKWLIEARNISPERLKELEIDDNFSCSIVRCRKCGCGYIKDVLESRVANPEWEEETIKERLDAYKRIFSRRNINHIQYEFEIVKKLTDLVLRKKQDDAELSLLDFGCSLSVLSPMSRLMGYSDVVAYDPLMPPNVSQIAPDNTAINFIFTSDMEEIKSKAPYDAIICQSADEHFFDLQGEIRNIRDLLSDDGIVYFSHPVMDLDADIDLLRNEATVTDVKTLKRLRATFHVHHLNYVMPKMFKNILRKNGFREAKVIWLPKRVAGEKFFSVGNLKGFLVSLVKYCLGKAGSNYRKTEFFVEKV